MVIGRLRFSTAMESPPPSQERDRDGTRRSLGFSDLNMNPDGSVMTREQIISRRISNGQCPTCSNDPTQCFMIKKSRYNPLLRSKIPLSVDGKVYEGNCLACHPESDPNRLKKRRHRKSKKNRRVSSRSDFHSQRSFSSLPERTTEHVEDDSQTASLSFASASLSGSSTETVSSRQVDEHEFQRQLAAAKAASISHSDNSFLSPQEEDPDKFGASSESSPTESRYAALAQSQCDCSRSERLVVAGKREQLSAQMSALSLDSQFDSRLLARAVERGEAAASATTPMMRHGQTESLPILEAADARKPTGRVHPLAEDLETDCAFQSPGSSLDSNRQSIRLPNEAAVSSVRNTTRHTRAESMPLLHATDNVNNSMRRVRPLPADNETNSAFQSSGTNLNNNRDSQRILADESNCAAGKTETGNTMAELQTLVQDLIDQGAGNCAIDVIANAVLEQPGCLELVDYGILAMWKMSRESRALKETIIYSSALDAIVQGMAASLSQPDVQEKGCGLLWSLAVDGKNRSNIAAAGGCSCLLDSLVTHVSVETVVAMAIGAIRALSFDPEARVALETKGAAQAVAHAMKAYLTSEPIQVNGCVALSNLAADPATGEVSVCSSEEIDAVAQALAAYANSVEIQLSGCFALRRYVIAAVDTVSSCCLPINKLVETAAARFPAECGDLAQEVLKHLASLKSGASISSHCEEAAQVQLSESPTNLNNPSNCAAIYEIIGAMFEDSSCVEVQVKGLQDMWALCSQAVENCDTVSKSPALDVIAETMAAHQFIENIQENALRVIREIALSTAENKIRIVRSGICSCIVQTLTAHSNNETIQKMAMAIINVLSEDEECREALKSF